MGFRECDRACSSHGGSMLCVESRYESQALAMFLQVSNRLNGNRRCSINTGGAGCAWIGLYESNDTATNSSADTWRWNAPGCTSTYRGYGFATMSNGFATMSNQGWGMWRDEVAEAQNTCICQRMLPSPPPSQPPPPSPPPWPPTPPPPTTAAAAAALDGSVRSQHLCRPPCLSSRPLLSGAWLDLQALQEQPFSRNSY